MKEPGATICRTRSRDPGARPIGVYLLGVSARVGALAIVVVGGFSSLGCGSSGSQKDELGQGQTLTVASDANAIQTKVSADGDHYAQGRNTFLVQFDPATTVLDKASAFMPVHGHGTPAAPTIAAEDGGGYRISDFIFNMPGIWDVTLDVTLADRSDKVEFSLDVP